MAFDSVSLITSTVDLIYNVASVYLYFKVVIKNCCVNKPNFNHFHDDVVTRDKYNFFIIEK